MGAGAGWAAVAPACGSCGAGAGRTQACTVRSPVVSRLAMESARKRVFWIEGKSTALLSPS